MAVLHESLPTNPLHAEVVVHVRAHQKRALRRKEGPPARALQLLFGATATAQECDVAAGSAEPILALVDAVAKRTGASVVELPCDADYLATSREWLVGRKVSDEAFKDVVAHDLETLLRLSEARDAAVLGDMFNAKSLGMPILITGETGTGKDLLARAITSIWANADPSRKNEMKVLFVAGIEKQFVNDEIFGHASGAFTGATKARVGRLEEANGHTLLIDELGDLSADAQVRLLRFLETGEFSRGGENEVRWSRVRVLAATAKDLDAAVADGNFRADLLHRIGAVQLRLPPLRDRKTHLDEVVSELLAAKHGAVPAVSRQAAGALRNHAWSGNLRELKQVLSMAKASADAATITLDDVPSHLRRGYLDLPLVERAADLISDEASDHPLTQDLVEHRVAVVGHALATSVAGRVPDDLQKVVEFLSEIPDTAPDHVATVERALATTAAVEEADERAQVAGAWSFIASANTDDRATPTIARMVGLSQDDAEAAMGRATERYAAMRLEESAWFTMMQKVRELPLLKGASETDVQNVVALFYRVVLSLPHELGREIVTSFKKGGLKGAWETVEPLLNAGDDDEEGAPEPKTPPRQRDRKYWQRLAASPTMREARDSSGYSEKTIRTYFEKLGLKGKWEK